MTRLLSRMKIKLFCLPEHSTSLLQPGDTGIYKKATTAFNDELSLRHDSNVDSDVGKAFAEALLEVNNLVFTSNEIRKSFAKARMFPFEPILVNFGRCCDSIPHGKSFICESFCERAKLVLPQVLKVSCFDF